MAAHCRSIEPEPEADHQESTFSADLHETLTLSIFQAQCCQGVNAEVPSPEILQTSRCRQAAMAWCKLGPKGGGFCVVVVVVDVVVVVVVAVVFVKDKTMNGCQAECLNLEILNFASVL